MKRLIIISIISTSFALSNQQNPYTIIKYKQKLSPIIRPIVQRKEKKFNKCMKIDSAMNCIYKIETERDTLSMLWRLKRIGIRINWLR